MGRSAAVAQTTRSQSWMGDLPLSMLVPWLWMAKAPGLGSRGRSRSTLRTSAGGAAGSEWPAAARRVG